MVLRVGRNFQYSVPDDWHEAQDGARWVYHGPAGEELIISSWQVDGSGSLAERRRLQEQLLANAMQAARKASVQSGLVNTLALRREEAVTEVSCWCFVSETAEKDSLFVGGVAETDGGVMLVTLEAPWGPQPLGQFRAFLKALRRPVQ